MNDTIYNHYIATDWSIENMAIARITKKSNKTIPIDVPSDIAGMKSYLKKLSENGDVFKKSNKFSFGCDLVNRVIELFKDVPILKWLTWSDPSFAVFAQFSVLYRKKHVFTVLLPF